jgi:hypothetical protein
VTESLSKIYGSEESRLWYRAGEDNPTASISWRETSQEKSLLVSWASKGHNAIVILAKRDDHFGALASSYPLVTRWVLAPRRDEDIFEPNERLDRSEDPLTGLELVDFLDSNLFASVEQIAAITKVPRSTVFNHSQWWNYTV